MLLTWMAAIVGACGESGQDRAAVIQEPLVSAPGLLYGRVAASDGTVYEGRLRWGSDQEALWVGYFNGYKDENPWIAYAPTERRSVGILGMRIASWEGEANGRRPFMARLGDMTRVERSGRDLLVTLKSGSEFVLDRMAADDFGGGMRVWDEAAGTIDLREMDVRSVEFLPAPEIGEAPRPLYGTVYTTHGELTGLIEWNRAQSLTSDELLGLTSGVALILPFDTIRSIAPRAEGGATVALVDGTEVVLEGTRDVDDDNLGTYVDDPRYGRVSVSWDALERVEFSPVDGAPSYDDFPAGRLLFGSVTNRSGDRFEGRLVYDLDESETTETLDAPIEGLNYTIPFGLIEAIVFTRPSQSAGYATVTLRTGEELRLELTGDLSPDNTGVLVLSEDGGEPKWVPWGDVARIDLDGR